jgi:hypothetical protein
VSWDLLIVNAPLQVTSAEQLTSEIDLMPLGAAADIRQRLSAWLPDLDLADPTWGDLNGPTWSIELGLGSDDPVQSISLHVRGTGDDVLAVIAGIVARVGGRALDSVTGEFLTEEQTGVTSWQAFQQFRDGLFRR